MKKYFKHIKLFFVVIISFWNINAFAVGSLPECNWGVTSGDYAIQPKEEETSTNTIIIKFYTPSQINSKAIEKDLSLRKLFQLHTNAIDDVKAYLKNDDETANKVCQLLGYEIATCHDSKHYEKEYTATINGYRNWWDNEDNQYMIAWNGAEWTKTGPFSGLLIASDPDTCKKNPYLSLVDEHSCYTKQTAPVVPSNASMACKSTM